MRQVKLYALKEEIVSVTGDYVEIHGMQNNATRVKYSNDFVVNAPVHIQRLPIERYVDVVKTTNNVSYQNKESLVAFDPEIRKLLGINQKKVEDELHQLQIRYNEMFDDKKRFIETNRLLNDCVDSLEKDLAVYKTMSFWKRLIFLFKGEV